MIIPSWLHNLIPPLPPGPAPPPSTGGQTGGSGTPDDPAVIVVIGQRPPPGPPVGYGPYGGMTGAEARAARDMAWAMSSPADRVRAMGLDPDASIDGTRDSESATQEIIEIPESVQRTLALALQEEIENATDLAAVQVSAMIGRAGETLVHDELIEQGWTILGEQIRVFIPNDDGSWTLRIYDFLVEDPYGNRRFLEVKANYAERNARQVDADNRLAEVGGMLSTSKLEDAGFPNGSTAPSTTVDIVRVWLIPPSL